jgi:SAM-dependent methyltransferase
MAIDPQRPAPVAPDAPPAVPCPFCGSTDRIDYSGRPRALCGGCGAFERHRALVDTQRGVLERGAGRRALEVGPLSPLVFGDYLRERGWEYTAMDQSRRGNPVDPRNVDFIDVEVDLCDLAPFGDGSIHLVMAQHVIEEIIDYRRALSEIARVLADDGVALLEIPFRPTQPESEPHEARAYGNVWTFGADLPVALAEPFGDVRLVPLELGSYRGTLFACREPRAS